MAQVGSQNEPLHERALFGYYSSAWSRLPLLFGVSGTLEVIISSSTLAAGVNNLDAAAVPAATIWVITNLSMHYDGTVAGVSIHARIVRSAVQYNIFQVKPPVTTVQVDRQGWWILLPGDNLRLNVQGATLNDDAFLEALGFTINIT